MYSPTLEEFTQLTAQGNLIPVTRRLLAHCGLSWQDACLEFHSRPGAVGTASAVQVRSPLYGSSVGKWRHYEQQLQPLARHLVPGG